MTRLIPLFAASLLLLVATTPASAGDVHYSAAIQTVGWHGPAYDRDFREVHHPGWDHHHYGHWGPAVVVRPPIYAYPPVVIPAPPPVYQPYCAPVQPRASFYYSSPGFSIGIGGY